MVNPILAQLSLAAVLSVAALLPTATAQIHVIGDDDRQMVDLAEAPWVSIGRVNRGGRAFCTGILIAPDRVLTAAHCLFDVAQNRWAPASAIHFLSGYVRGDYAAESVAASYAVADGYERAHGHEMATMQRDWAVITLARTLDVPTTPIWPMEFADAGMALEDGVMLQAGYSGDRPHMLSVHEDCGLVGVSGGTPLLLHECDAIEGDSGSPLLMRRHGRYGIIGLHIARTVSEGYELGVAIPSQAFAESIRQFVGGNAVVDPPAE